MLRINHLRLRSLTRTREFGADIPLRSGLNVIQAGNSSGKSTSLQAIIYALGLERSLGPQLEIPLPYAMRERIHENPNSAYEPVLASYIEMEIQNSAGETLTIRRDVVGGSDKKLIRTWPSRRHSINDEASKPRDFFVHDAGAAQREDGFHYHLTNFLGWHLPIVSRFDGSEIPLYLEAIFPMLFVEQKRGWSTIQGPFPTFLRIQDVARRVVEFLLDLDAAAIRRQRAELKRQLIIVQQRWDGCIARLEDSTFRTIRARGIPKTPTIELSKGQPIYCEVFYADEWLGVSDVINKLANEIRDLEARETPTSEVAAPELQLRVAQAAERIDRLIASIETIKMEFNAHVQERNAIRQRLAALRIDLKRNQDALKLKKLGSSLGRAASEHVCPTCHQEIEGELMPIVANVGMGLEENITFVDSQIELYEASLRDGSARIEDFQARYNASKDELAERQHELRALRQALIQPSASPTRAIIEEIVRKQSLMNRLVSTQQIIDGLVDELRLIASEWMNFQQELKLLNRDDLTEKDLHKISRFEKLVQDHLGSYGFKSFQPNEIHLSKDNLRPLIYTIIDSEIVEKEINFEISASDAIRLKWAYYLSLLSVSKECAANHCGLVIFDEPGQQEMEAPSLRALLEWASGGLLEDQQLIIATSEPYESLNASLQGRYHLVNFDGLILQPI